MRRIIVMLIALSTLHYSLSTAFAQYTGGSYDGYDADTGADTGIGAKEVKMTGYAHQVFMVSQQAQPMVSILITDAEGGSITANDTTGDIRIRIPSGFNMTWDTSAGAAVFGGRAMNKCSAAVVFENANTTARIDVTGNFTAGDTLTVSGLRFANFTAVSPADHLGIDIYNASYNFVTDDKFIMIMNSSDVLCTGGAFDGHDISMSLDYIFGNNLKAESGLFEGVRFE